MHFECTYCKAVIKNPITPVGLCSCGKPLSVRYEWENSNIGLKVDTNEESLWRYASVLPSVKNRVSLGEGFTPLIPISDKLFVKNETVNPTGSFKDRGMSLAISMAKEQQVENICLPSAGNAGISAAAYCKEAGMNCHVFLPESIPKEYLSESKRYSKHVQLKGNTIADAAKEMIQQKQENWFDISTLKEPFRVEGKKTLGYEIAEQLGWKFPDIIVYETGGGTGLIGMWKAFQELKSIGKVSGSLPRMVAAQSTGCAPVVDAFQKLDNKTEFWENSQTKALGLNVPGPIGGYWILRILYESNGIAIDVSENELTILTEEFNTMLKINAGPEAGVVWGAYKKLRNIDWIDGNQSVVLFATGTERCKL